MEDNAKKFWEFKRVDGSWMPKVVIGDVRKVIDYLPENFIDCVITSPPYWMQRDYKHPAQVGRERTPEEYVYEIVRVFEKLRPKLKKTATIFLNVGYKYLDGELILIPEMIALEMRRRGFLLKNKIIWAKPNAMPTPARDRLNGVYEPILFFIRSDGREVHYFNLEGISQKPKTLKHYANLLSLSPQKYLGAMVVDSISERGKKGKIGRVFGVRYVSGKPIEVLVRWDDSKDDSILLGGPLRNYPEKVGFRCPMCSEQLSSWDIKLSFANHGRMICPQCEAILCESEETFPLPDLPYSSPWEDEVHEVINPDVEIKKYISKMPKNSKFIEAGMEKVSMASPAGRLAIQGEYLAVKRRWDVPQPLIAKYLRYWRKRRGVTIEEIDRKIGYSYTAGHWFRLDFGWWGKGGSIPRPADWFELKELLRFNDIYDRLVTERVAVFQTVKPHEEGKNPGDIWEITLEPYPDVHFSIFPRKLVENALLVGCPPRGIVLDPFAGSGTVGEVALKLGRKAILIELIYEFLELIRKRCDGKIEVIEELKSSG